MVNRYLRRPVKLLTQIYWKIQHSNEISLTSFEHSNHIAASSREKRNMFGSSYRIVWNFKKLTYCFRFPLLYFVNNIKVSILLLVSNLSIKTHFYVATSCANKIILNEFFSACIGINKIYSDYWETNPTSIFWLL